MTDDPTLTANDTHTATGDDGASLTITARGGHLLGWRPAGGPERLWLSPLAATTPGEAIRGGVPVIFPRFAAYPLTDAHGEHVESPRHGVARTAVWEAAASAQPDGTAVVQARLQDDAHARTLWPWPFHLTLTAHAQRGRLSINLAVANPGPEAFAFSAALHTYLRVTDAARATVSGLGPEPRTTLGPIDEVHRGVAAAGVTLTDPELAPLRITAEGFADVVFWNPGPGHGLPDVPVGGENDFVCLEAVAL